MEIEWLTKPQWPQWEWLQWLTGDGGSVMLHIKHSKGGERGVSEEESFSNANNIFMCV